MNDELQSAIQQLINKTLSGVDTTVDFLSAELPDYVYQLLLWYGIKSFVIFIISIAIIGIFITTLLKYWPKNWNETTDTFDMGYIFGHTGGLMFLVPALVTGVNLTWLKIWIAPKVWLLEYAGSLVK